MRLFNITRDIVFEDIEVEALRYNLLNYGCLDPGSEPTITEVSVQEEINRLKTRAWVIRRVFAEEMLSCELSTPFGVVEKRCVGILPMANRENFGLFTFQRPMLVDFLRLQIAKKITRFIDIFIITIIVDDVVVDPA